MIFVSPQNNLCFLKSPATRKTWDDQTLIQTSHLDEVQVEMNILWVPALRVKLLGGSTTPKVGVSDPVIYVEWHGDRPINGRKYMGFTGVK